MSVQPRKPGHLEKMIENQPVSVDPDDPDRFQMRIARDGTWYHQGGPIRRMGLVKLFATVLRRDEAGDFWLVTPVERGRIEVEDAPFTAVELIVAGEGKDQILSFRTNLDEIVPVDADHPLRVAENEVTGEPSPYVTVRENLEALITRPIFYDLVSLAEEQWDGGGTILGIWSGGVLFPLGDTVE
ncbi:MAG: DUF1285 domain-containing protein [Alphaproteobacteria bacterium]|nr:DUF1285 domain-containing protein [Alphaproteobacteria bacterium]